MNIKFPKSWLKVVIIPMILFQTGCVYIVVGGIGALGGYVVSSDTIEGVTENEVEVVYDAAIEMLSIMGLIQEEDEASAMIIANVQGTHVTVTIMQNSDVTVKLRIKARKAFMPKISVAQDVFVKIMTYVNG